MDGAGRVCWRSLQSRLTIPARKCCGSGIPHSQGTFPAHQTDLAGATRAPGQASQVRVQALGPGTYFLWGQMQPGGGAALEPGPVTVWTSGQDMALSIDQQNLLPAKQIPDLLLVAFR